MSQVLVPRKLEELWPMLHEHPEAALMAGGTDLLVRRRAGIVSPEVIVCLEHVAELQGVHRQGDELVIGAATTHTRCLASSEIQAHAPVLHQALGRVGGPQIRNMGTIGGNICTASPAGDSLPALTVLRARVELRSKGAKRLLPLSEFILGPGRTAFGPGEILTGVRIPLDDGFTVRHFEKVGQRQAMAIAVVSLAAMIRLGSGGIVREARLALGSVGPTIVEPQSAEDCLVGRRLSTTALREAARLVRDAVSPIDDIRASADYRRQVAGNLLMRLRASAEQRT
jgi:xanthine dehydrogenase FAD-binding subunit